MFDPADSRLSPDEFSRRLDEAKARAAVLRAEAMREFGSSFFAAAAAAGRRLAQAARTARPSVRRAVPTAR
jgi:hypothetical protein